MYEEEYKYRRAPPSLSHSCTWCRFFGSLHESGISFWTIRTMVGSSSISFPWSRTAESYTDVHLLGVDFRWTNEALSFSSIPLSLVQLCGAHQFPQKVSSVRLTAAILTSHVLCIFRGFIAAGGFFEGLEQLRLCSILLLECELPLWLFSIPLILEGTFKYFLCLRPLRKVTSHTCSGLFSTSLKLAASN